MSEISTDKSFSKEHVDQLNATIAKQGDAIAKLGHQTAELSAFKQTIDDRMRANIKSLQPDIVQYVDTLVNENSEHSNELASIVDFAHTCHTSTRAVDTSMPLARMISCASAQMKRKNKDSEENDAKLAAFGQTMQDLEKCQSELAAKTQRVGEMSTLCDQQELAIEKLKGLLAPYQSTDFSRIGSRESNTVPTMDYSEPASAVSSVQQVSCLASKGAGPSAPRMEDALLSFINSSSKDVGSNVIGRSSTSHSILGAAAGADFDISNALRAN